MQKNSTSAMIALQYCTISIFLRYSEIYPKPRGWTTTKHQVCKTAMLTIKRGEKLANFRVSFCSFLLLSLVLPLSLPPGYYISVPVEGAKSKPASFFLAAAGGSYVGVVFYTTCSGAQLCVTEREEGYPSLTTAPPPLPTRRDFESYESNKFKGKKCDLYVVF